MKGEEYRDVSGSIAPLSFLWYLEKTLL